MRIDSTAINQTYESIASGKRINSAADDAAGSAISEKLKAQTSGVQQGTENAATANNVLKTAEGALNSMHDQLQRMRELAVKASNSLLTSSDKQAIQKEIDQIKDSIADIADNTEFNKQELINGDFQNKNIASNADGSGIEISIPDSGAEALGITDFDVTGDFNLDTIDQAISIVSESRSNLGAASNRLDSTITSNRIAAYNQTAANSRIEDADLAKQITELRNQEALQQYQYFMQEQQMQQQGQFLNLLG